MLRSLAKETPMHSTDAKRYTPTRCGTPYLQQMEAEGRLDEVRVRVEAGGAWMTLDELAREDAPPTPPPSSFARRIRAALARLIAP
jgi:hypothetical protein